MLVLKSQAKRNGCIKKAVGQIIDFNSDGTVNVLSSQLISGVTPETADINEFLKNSPDITNPGTADQPSATHVETWVAWRMRASGIQHADLLINNADGPCAGPFACENAVSAILPAGSSLTVWYPNNTGDGFGASTLWGIALDMLEDD